MSAIRRMNEELTERLGREPDIYEQIDMIIFAVVRERLMELAVIHQIDPTDLSQSQYNHAMKCAKEIQRRNPEIFSFDDSDGGDYE
jgi:hypothetical protein